MYCDRHFSDLRKIEPELQKLGYKVLAISPDKPEKLQTTKSKHSMAYQLLSDSKLEAARAMRIAFELDQKTLAAYKEYGIDLNENSGEDHFYLPVPSVFILDKKGVNQFQYVNPDYQKRLDVDVLLVAAKAALKQTE